MVLWIKEDELGHVADVGGKRNAYKVLIGKLEWKKDHSEELGIDGRKC
jgi:hypothetical protein